MYPEADEDEHSPAHAEEVKATEMLETLYRDREGSEKSEDDAEELEDVEETEEAEDGTIAAMASPVSASPLSKNIETGGHRVTTVFYIYP